MRRAVAAEHVGAWAGALERTVRAAWLPLVLGLVARVGYWVLLARDYVPVSDDAQYHELARNLVDGHGFAMAYPWLELHPTAFRPPLYPALLAGVYAVTGESVGAGRLCNLVLGLVVVGLAYVVGTRVAGGRAGLLAGCAVALYPPLVVNDVVLLAESLALVLLLVLVLVVADGRPVAAGVVTGLLVLTRPNAQAVALATAAWLLWRIGWKGLLRFALAGAIVVAPWIVRNWAQMGSPVLVTSNGFNLAAIYSPEAHARGDFVDPSVDPSFESYRLLQSDELAWSRELQRLAVDSLRDDPAQVLPVLGRNARWLFELDPSHNDSAERLDGRNLDFRHTTLPLFYLVTVAGLAGLWLHRRDRLVQFLALSAAATFAASLFLVAPPRLRAGFDLACCIGLGLLVDRLLDRLRRGRAEVSSAASDRPGPGAAAPRATLAG